ncbi:MAG: M28 family peptidase, partial [Bradyrhizobium sp.]|uniref:M28 family peptidase n=1 Tax=Bradyrhizobium sp. TaxID=376 RepID=UPI001E0C7B8F
LGSDADIALVETEPFALVEPRRELAGALAEVRRGGHKGIVILTRGSRPGLFLLNAPSFRTPFGPPALQVSSAEAEWLMAQAQRRAEVGLVVNVQKFAAQAFNVTTEVAGSDSALAPLVVTTPRSGWWQCASERGGGLACWLETIRALAAAKPARNCLFAAFSGHEIGFLGIDAYLMPRSDLVKRARAWIHLGANIGAPRQPNLVQVSDAFMERWIVAALEKNGLAVDHEAEAGLVPRGEAGTLHRGGARYAAVVCGTEVFHNPADRWPDAIDVASLARYAEAISEGACELALRD